MAGSARTKSRDYRELSLMARCARRFIFDTSTAMTYQFSAGRSIARDNVNKKGQCKKKRAFVKSFVNFFGLIYRYFSNRLRVM